MERNATGDLENPFISLGEINGGSGAAEQLIYFTIYYQLNVQFNIIKWELVRTFYFFQSAHFCLFNESTLNTDFCLPNCLFAWPVGQFVCLPISLFRKQGSWMW